MQYATKAYKQAMKDDLRGESYVYVLLGVIDGNAQVSAQIEGDFTDYSSPELVTGNPSFEAYYATCEQNQAKVDGNVMFMPRDSAMYALFQGAVTEEMFQPVTFVFEGFYEISIRGLTINFGDYYPTEFTISNGTVTRTYTNNSKEFICTDAFENCHYITITPISMVGGQQRLRILSILFGVGLYFTNTNLLKTSQKIVVDHIMSRLPSKSFNFTVPNFDRKFCQDNPTSYSPFLQQKQICEYSYGRKLPDGTIYKIKGGKTLLKKWTSNDTQATFETVGRLDYMVDTYYKGKFYPEGITAYQLAVDVCTDAGLVSGEYNIDEYLKDEIIYNPLPITTHKACLQLIGNACRCVLYEDRDGVVTLRSSFIPDITHVSGTNEEAYSDVTTVVLPDTAYNYATGEEDYVRVNGEPRFFPRSGEYLNVGYVTELGENGEVTITFEAQFNLYGIQLQFGDAIPQLVTIKGYYGGTETYSVDADALDVITSVPIEFMGVDEIKIFITPETNQRVHLQKVLFGDMTDYTLTYHELKQPPTAAMLERISRLNIHVYNYRGSDEEPKTLATVHAVVGSNTVRLSNPSYGYTLAYKDGSGTLSITDSGAYYVTFDASDSGEVEITGSAYVQSNSMYIDQLHETGTEKELKNQLISSNEMASKQAEWIREYFLADTEYSLTYRGEPRIDADDLIYLENKNVDKNLVRVGTTQIDTASGMSMSCKITARRVSYEVRA